MHTELRDVILDGMAITNTERMSPPDNHNTLRSIGIPRRCFEGVLNRLTVGAVILAMLPAIVPNDAHAVIRPKDRVDGRSASSLGKARAALPDVTMMAGALVTADGRVLWSRRVNDRRAMASLTKIMTAVVAMEDGPTDDLVTVPAASATVGESTSFLRPGERLPMHDLLEALLVKSGNDAAVAIARHVGGSEEAFVVKMNRKAAELGLTRTRFENSHGLDEHGHFSSANDLAVLARYAMTKPEFRGIVGEKRARIGSGRRAERVMSTNLLLGNYQGANGIKTGYTSDAGYCVIDSAQRDGIELYAVVLGTSGELSRFRDARDLLDFGFAHYRPQSLATSGTVLGEAVVTDYLDVTVPAAVSAETTVAVFDLAGPIRRTVRVAAVPAPVSVGQVVGVATFTQAGKTIATVPLVATADVARPNPFERAWIAVVRAWRAVTGTS
jgi:D-alanyl-D-alanine carboxypeptidase (penicillin-binding protein 5/6)